MKKVSKNEVRARAELALMGIASQVPCGSKDNLKIMIETVIGAIKHLVEPTSANVVMEECFKFAKKASPAHICVNKIMDMYMLTVTLATPAEPYDLTSEDGVFSYVYNFSAPFCSELGYSYFKKTPMGIKRIS